MTPQIKQRIDQLRHGEVPEGYKKTKVGIVPSEWNYCTISDCLEKVDNPVEVDPNTLYTQIGIRSHGKGLFYKEPITGKELGNKSVFWVEPNCFVLNIVFAWEQAFGKTTADEVGMIGSHRFPMYRPINDSVDLDYLIYYFMTKRGTDVLDAASPGGAGRNRTLGQDRFMRSKILLPPLAEQKKIAEILSAQDKLIALKEKLIEEKKRQKKYLMQQLLTGKKRLPGFSGEWEKKKVLDFATLCTDSLDPHEYPNELFNVYSLPSYDNHKTSEHLRGTEMSSNKFIVSKGMILFNKLNVRQKRVWYIDSISKERMLSSTEFLPLIVEGINPKFLTQYLLTDYATKYFMLRSSGTSNSQQRILPNDLMKHGFRVPSTAEQEKIVSVFETFDKEIELFQKQLNQEKQKKIALMQLLLSGVVRVNE